MQRTPNRYEQPPVTAPSTSRGLCPLCGGTEHSQWRRMNLLRCTYCGLVFDGRVWEEGSDREVEAEWFDEGTPSEITGWVRTFEHLNNRRTGTELHPWFLRPGPFWRSEWAAGRS